MFFSNGQSTMWPHHQDFRHHSQFLVQHHWPQHLVRFDCLQAVVHLLRHHHEFSVNLTNFRMLSAILIENVWRWLDLIGLKFLRTLNLFSRICVMDKILFISSILPPVWVICSSSVSNCCEIRKSWKKSTNRHKAAKKKKKILWNLYSYCHLCCMFIFASHFINFLPFLIIGRCDAQQFGPTAFVFIRSFCHFIFFLCSYLRTVAYIVNENQNVTQILAAEKSICQVSGIIDFGTEIRNERIKTDSDCDLLSLTLRNFYFTLFVYFDCLELGATNNSIPTSLSYDSVICARYP